MTLTKHVRYRIRCLNDERFFSFGIQRSIRDRVMVMEDHLTRRRFEGSDWFVGASPTLADLALFPAIALSRDFDVDHDEYPALRRWMRRVRALPGFVTMPGIPDYH